MGKVTGRMARGELPAKVAALYQAVLELIEEGADIAELKVSDITKKAGIGKGTAYDYFDTREEIIAYALLYFMDSQIITIRTQSFHRNRTPVALRTASSPMARGIPPRSVPLGQIHLQNQGVPAILPFTK